MCASGGNAAYIIEVNIQDTTVKYMQNSTPPKGQ